MRNLKRKIGVSVLAIACLGASAFGVQSALAASAEETVKIAEGLSMEHGASVSLNEEFSGIRWKTNVVASECSAASEIGVLVAPNVAAADLTVDTAKVMKLKADLDLTQDQTFYTVIDYNEIADRYTGTLTTEEALKKAYALELTARPYMVVNGEYQYADMTGINTARSARQVAIAAELAGEIDEKYRNVEGKKALADNAEKYYGMTDKYTPGVLSIGAAGTPYIDLEKTTNTVTATIDLKGGTFKEAIIGAERVEATYADGTLTITEANYIPTGENYITVFTEEGGLYTAPVIGATKVFDEMTDFDDFKYIRKNLNSKYKVAATIQETDVDGNEIDASKLVHDGYYVLAGDLDASDYDTSDYTYEKEGYSYGGWLGVKSFMTEIVEDEEYELNPNLGLTGTFNGLGYTVSNLTMKRKNAGLFEFINGGTVKNFSLETEMTSAATYNGGLAYYAFDPVVENVRITTDSLSTNNRHCAMFYYLHQTADYSAKLENVFVWAKYSTTTKNTGGLFGTMHTTSKTAFKWDNVYSLCPAGLSLTFTEAGAITSYAYGEEQKTTENEKGYNVYTVKGAETTVEPSTVWYLEGAYQYYTNKQWQMNVGEGVLDSFVNDPSGCWKLTSSSTTIENTEYTYYLPEFK